MQGLIGSQWLPRCLFLSVVGLAANLVLAGFMVLYVFYSLPSARGAAAVAVPGAGAESGEPLDLSTLNVRLSTRAIQPPEGLVKRTVVLPGVRGARPLYGEPARAAILEDDARRRVLILATDGQDGATGQVSAHLLRDFDLERYLPAVRACAEARQCAFDRNPTTGGLACVAMCLVEALRG